MLKSKEAKFLYNHNYNGCRSRTSASNVLCSDGRRRHARITTEPNTFFSIPASVKVHGKTVSGFITTENDDIHFTAYSNRKNGDLLP